MDNILSEIDKAYQKGINDPRFQPAIKDLKEKIAAESVKSKSEVNQKENSEFKKSKKEEKNIIE